MNYTIAIITLLLLVLLILIQIKTWKLRAFLSPAIYFAAIWTMGPIGCLVLTPLGFSYNPYPEYIDELNLLVSFTALSFIFWTRKGRNKICNNPIDLRFCGESAFHLLCSIIMVAAVFDFISLGGNLNMGAARENLVEINANRSTLVGYSHVLCTPLSLYAGYELCKGSVNKKGKVTIWMYLPLIANLIFSIDVGGRVDIIYSFLTYIMGASLFLAKNFSISMYKKPLMLIIIGVIVFVTFINYVGQQRAEHYGGTKDLAEVYLQEHNPIIAALYGPISYLNSSYLGYQLRRVDAVNQNEYGYGKYTFNGFINWTIPFGNLIGLGDFSIAKALNIYYDPQETYDFQREYYYTTHSCYLTMIKDYGFWGTLICIFILTGISHNLFVKIQRRHVITYATTFYFYYIFWNYWAKSPFYGHLSQGLLMPLYGFLLIDIFNYIFGRIRFRF